MTNTDKWAWMDPKALTDDPDGQDLTDEVWL